MESGGSTFGGGNSNSNKGPMMKAPGGDGSYMSRKVFEENPKRYFTDLRAGQNKETQTKEGEGGGGWGTFWKVAGAAAVVAGGIYSIVKQMEATRVPVGAGSGGGGSSGGGGGSSGGDRGGGCGCGTGDSDSDDGGDGGLQTKEISVWTKPKVGWLKLNVDGSLLREIQSAGCGGVLRNDSGKWVKGFAQKLESSLYENETEREGILRGLKWAKEKGVRKLEVESDNKGIVDMVNDGTKSKDTRIVDIGKLLRSPDWQTTLTWIPGGANRVADKLADIASKKLTSYDLKEFDDPPSSCLTALADDLRFAKRVLVGAAGGGGGGIDGDSDDDGGGDRGRYSIIVEQMEANRVPVEAGGSGVAQPKVWTKPEVGWLKLNVDGSLRRKTQLAGCGGVLRDDSGNWVKGFAQKLDSSLNEDETEREGILRGLKWAKEWAKKKGVRKLEVESDNQGIVDMVNDGTKSKDTRIVDIREELLRSRSPDWQTTLTWIPGVANGVADKLADIGRNLTSDDLKEYDDPPPGSCRTAFNNDFDQC